MAREKKGSPKETTIVGFIEEIELEDDETGLQIVDEEHAYRVEMDRQGRKLLDYVEEEVEATGFVTKGSDAREIKITRFRLVEGYDDEEEEVDFDEDFLDHRDDD